MKVKIGLIGFGKTGKAVASVILQNKEFSLEWVFRRTTILENRSVPEFLGIESDEPGLIYSSEHINIGALLDKHPVDIIVDFSSSESIHSYGAEAAIRGVKLISAISHYGQRELDLLDRLSAQTTVFWSPNITLGVNYLLFSAQFLQRIAPGIDIEIVEEHFKQKEGVSGTAVKIAHALKLDVSQINSVRAGGIVGKHELIFGFPYQTVRLIHESISREAFGNGAIFVAQNLMDKPNGLYNFEDILRPYFKL
ncbi:dihydrodipicolinate reductase C-terminal domain-containing protein [Pedobacter sp. Du54]|uniref:4-hydroxy-tetrahydrodipicolinate reductase n=1 Tax=Pedobacter anseongensis TaxID=3133439 RepID=UPI0030B13CE1